MAFASLDSEESSMPWARPPVSALSINIEHAPLRVLSGRGLVVDLCKYSRIDGWAVVADGVFRIRDSFRTVGARLLMAGASATSDACPPLTVAGTKAARFAVAGGVQSTMEKRRFAIGPTTTARAI